MFTDAVIYGAAHVIYSGQFADALERRGGQFPGGQNVCNYVPALTPAEHDPIIRPILDKIDKAMGIALVNVFVAGGIIGETAQIDALSDLLLGVQGHGVSIEDNYADAWEKGCAVYKASPYLCPCNLPHDDMDGYGDLANEKIDAAGYPPEPEEGAEPDATYEPIIATAFAWHNGQTSDLYAFASTREVQSAEHKAGILQEVDANLAWHKDHAEQEPGDVAKLQRLRAAVKAAEPGTKFFYV
jgi:hypothetical protein